jgi:type I restriction enzyme S subunit
MVGDSLPQGWNWTTIDQVKKPDSKAIVSGPFGSNIGSRFFVESGIPVIRGNNLTTDMRRFVEDGFVFITDEKAEELKNCEALPNDLIFTAAGTLGQVGIIPPNSKYPRYIISNKQMRARLDENIILPLFAFLWLSSTEMVEYIEQRNTGSSVPLINLTVLRQLPIPLPPLPEQRAIARILGALDDKIELNRRMNHTLEEMARALFKSWFVDFDPVTAKAEGRVPFGMNADTASLFPAEFVETEEGVIPKGWRTGTVREAFDLIMGQSPPGETYNEVGDGIAFYQGRTDFGTRYPTPRIYCTAPTRYANPGDTLVSVRAPVGDVNMANEKCSIGRGLAAIRHKSGSRSFTYYSMLFLKEEFDVFEGEGTLFGSISGEGFRNIKTVIPSLEIVSEFERKVYSIDQTIENNEAQIKSLASIRNGLLPKLMSGEVRVKG